MRPHQIFLSTELLRSKLKWKTKFWEISRRKRVFIWIYWWNMHWKIVSTKKFWWLKCYVMGSHWYIEQRRMYNTLHYIRHTTHILAKNFIAHRIRIELNNWCLKCIPLHSLLLPHIEYTVSYSHTHEQTQFISPFEIRQFVHRTFASTVRCTRVAYSNQLFRPAAQKVWKQSTLDSFICVWFGRPDTLTTVPVHFSVRCQCPSQCRVSVYTTYYDYFHHIYMSISFSSILQAQKLRRNYILCWKENSWGSFNWINDIAASPTNQSTQLLSWFVVEGDSSLQLTREFLCRSISMSIWTNAYAQSSEFNWKYANRYWPHFCA